MTRRAAPASVHGIICCRAFGDFSHNALSRFHLRLFQTQMSASRPAASSAANPSAARTPSARTAAWLPASRVSGPRPTDAATVSLMSRAPRTAKKYSPTIRVSSPPDVDECADGSACGRHAVCQNVAGTYVCVCDAGFTAAPDGNSCEGMWPCRPMRGVWPCAMCVCVCVFQTRTSVRPCPACAVRLAVTTWKARSCASATRRGNTFTQPLDDA